MEVFTPSETLEVVVFGATLSVILFCSLPPFRPFGVQSRTSVTSPVFPIQLLIN